MVPREASIHPRPSIGRETTITEHAMVQQPSMRQVPQIPPTFSSSATLNAQFWLEQFPWRPTAAWAVIAALLTAGINPLTLDWRTVVLVLLLADPLWGSIWRLAAGREELLPLQSVAARHKVWLPYLLSGSPAARLLDWNQSRALPLLFRVGLPSLLLAGGIAVVLTPVAIWMTLCVFLFSVLGWITRRSFQSPAALLHSAVTITLPWLLTLTLFQTQVSDANRIVYLLFILLWTTHNWGEQRGLRTSTLSTAFDRLGLVLLALSEIGIATLLIYLHTPFWVAILILLWLPTWLAIYYRRPMQHLNFSWLLAMLLSAWAFGQSL